MIKNPGDIPNYLGAQEAGHQAMLWHNSFCQKKWFNDASTMNSSLIDRFLTLLHTTFTAEYKLIRTGNCKQIFQECFQWFLTKYTNINEVDCTAKEAAMTQPWNPADGFETLVVQLTKGLIFAGYAGAPISDVNVVDMEVGLTLDTGLYAEE